MRFRIALYPLLALLAVVVFAAPEADAPDVKNGSFEQSIDLPLIWMRDAGNMSCGEVSRHTGEAHLGQYALQLSPNANNTDKQHLLGVTQIIDVEKWQGKRFRLSCWLKVSSGSKARVLTIGFKPDGTMGSTGLTVQDFPRSNYTQQNCYVNIAPGVNKLLIACIVEGTSGSAWIDDISLKREEPVVLSPTPQKLTAKLTVNASVKGRIIPARLFGNNLEWINDANGVWGTQTNQIRNEMVLLTKALGVGPLRFPGGFFADFYHWRDGISDRASRSSRPHGPGMDSSSNGFGTDEYLQFCQLTGAEPMLQANIITGSPQEAVEWLQYCNQPKMRVKLWELGNEQYLKSDDAVGLQSCLSIDDYIAKVKQFAPMMKQAQPGVQLIAVGGANMPTASMVSDERWNEKLLTQCGSMIDYLAVHNSYAVAGASASNASFDEIYQALLAYPILVKRNLAEVSAQIDRYAPADSKRIKLAVTEYGPLFAVEPKDPFIDHCKTMGSALYVASLMKAYMETPKMELANFFKLTEYSFMGCIGGDGGPKPSYYTLQLLRQQFGNHLVSSQVTSPTYNSRPVMQIEAVEGVPYLEAISSLSADGKRLSVMVINKHPISAISTKMAIQGFTAKAPIQVWQLKGNTLDSNNGKDLLDIPGFTWGKQASDPRSSQIDTGFADNIKPVKLSWSSKQLTAGISFPKLSITCMVFERQE